MSSETLDAIKMFYQDDEHSRQLPGKKDFVSISRNVHQQKRLLLSNLKELYSAFKLKNPSLELGFSNLLCETKMVHHCWCCWNSLCVCLHCADIKI